LIYIFLLLDLKDGRVLAIGGSGLAVEHIALLAYFLYGEEYLCELLVEDSEEG
jgi:hypothetical protein